MHNCPGYTRSSDPDVEKLRQSNEQLRTALEHYGDAHNWRCGWCLDLIGQKKNHPGDCRNDIYAGDEEEDGTRVARAALKTSADTDIKSLFRENEHLREVLRQVDDFLNSRAEWVECSRIVRLVGECREEIDQ